MSFENELNKPLKDKLKYFTKNELIDLIVRTDKLYKGIVDDYVDDILLRNYQDKEHQLYEACGKAENDYYNYIVYLQMKYGKSDVKFSEMTTEELQKLSDLQEKKFKANKEYMDYE